GQEHAIGADARLRGAVLVVQHHRRQVREAAAAGGPVVFAGARRVGGQCQRPGAALVQHPCRGLEQVLLGMHALELPAAESVARGRHAQGQAPARPQRHAPAHAATTPAAAPGCDNGPRTSARHEPKPVNDSLKTLIVVAFLLVIIWNLGSALYYLMVDRGESKRTVNALTRRIALSIGLILLVIIGIWTGVIQPHGVGG